VNLLLIHKACSFLNENSDGLVFPLPPRWAILIEISDDPEVLV
jgi:hypothetical protein